MDGKIRVLHIVGWIVPTGSGRNLVDMVVYRTQERVDTEVFCWTKANPDMVALLRDEHGIHCTVMELPHLIPSPRAVASLWRTIRRYRPHVIQTYHAPILDWIVRVISSLCRTPLNISMALTMGRDYWGQHRRLAWWFVHIGDRLTAPLVDYFTPNSTDVWRYFRDVEGVPEDRLIRIYNGIDVSRFVFTEEMRQRGRQLLGLSESDLCIGCVGTLKHQKGQAFLLQAFGSLTNQFPQTRLVFVGRGDSIYVQRLGEEAQRMGLADRCLFIGEVLDVRPVLAGIDVFALPSLVEGFPTVALEAMAMTRPCLVTNISGSREAVVHGETGFVVPPGNPEAIADGLSVLLSSPALRVKMGAAAQRRVLEHFTVQKMVTSYETLYERGLKEKGIYV